MAGAPSALQLTPSKFNGARQHNSGLSQDGNNNKNCKCRMCMQPSSLFMRTSFVRIAMAISGALATAITKSFGGLHADMHACVHACIHIRAIRANRTGATPCTRDEDSGSHAAAEECKYIRDIRANVAD